MGNILTSLTGGNVPNVVNPFFPVSLPTTTLPTAGESFDALSGINLTPEEIAATDFFGGQQDVRTRDIYSRLGLGGSTMQTQDLGANELARLAQEAGFETTNRGQAIQEQGVLGGQRLQEQQIQQQGTLAEQQLAVNSALQAQGQNITAQQNAFQQGASSLTNLSRLALSLFGVGGGGAATAAA